MIKAILYAVEKHGTQKRKGGEPYVTHPLAVALILEEKGFGFKYKKAGVFHDLFEDTDATEDEVLALSDYDVLTAVKLVTKEPGYKQSIYMSRIKANHIAWMIKLADRLHNLRSALKTDRKFKLKYIKETEEWYLDLARGTVFEEDIVKALNDLKLSIDI